MSLNLRTTGLRCTKAELAQGRRCSCKRPSIKWQRSCFGKGPCLQRPLLRKSAKQRMSVMVSQIQSHRCTSCDLAHAQQQNLKRMGCQCRSGTLMI